MQRLNRRPCDDLHASLSVCRGLLPFSRQQVLKTKSSLIITFICLFCLLSVISSECLRFIIAPKHQINSLLWQAACQLLLGSTVISAALLCFCADQTRSVSLKQDNREDGRGARRDDSLGAITTSECRGLQSGPSSRNPTVILFDFDELGLSGLTHTKSVQGSQHPESNAGKC